ncbi:hypothetical protein QCA50_006591 [Cerrena zonata]|uniref:Glycoside hydrolase 131 catalytic N-terminal domain-containing protein n=1 Tax=Cerrena zonata TaxID=2478898 RepID=A0AAW0GAR5_9APHY
MFSFAPLFFVALTSLLASATPIIYDGRASFNLTAANLDANKGPFLTVVKGSQNASHYTTLLGQNVLATPLWSKARYVPAEQVVSVSVDNSSIFSPGGNPQNGFRRTDLIAANDGEHTELLTKIETGVTAFHFSVKKDDKKPLNLSHEYQPVFIEPNDGTHVFDLQVGSPFTIPTGTLPSNNSNILKIRDHSGNILFSTDFTSNNWHNFAVQVDWTNLKLGVFYSKDNAVLAPVSKLVANAGAKNGTDGQGDFHVALLKLPIANPADSAAQQSDVPHFGSQEGTTEALLYSGVFVESVAQGVSVGYGQTAKALA